MLSIEESLQKPEYSGEFADSVAAVRENKATAESEARRLLALMTPEERLWLLDGDEEFWPGFPLWLERGFHYGQFPGGEVERLGVPGVRFSDGPRGAVAGEGTCFPVSMARGASFDVDLEKRIGRAIGEEIRSQGGNLFGGVCVNLLRHPAWGRAQETYGEDPFHVGVMGASLAMGAQENVIGIAKHFAVNSMENARFTVNVHASSETIHEVYVQQFRRIIDSGVMAIMSSYNSLNGEWCGQNVWLLTEVLREDLGFDGFVVSDWVFGMRDARKSLIAGLDIEMPFRHHRAADLPKALEEEPELWAEVDVSVVRILSTMLQHFSRIDGNRPEISVRSSEHIALAREAAARSIVLLKNEKVCGVSVLPLSMSHGKRIGVFGRLADVANTGDNGSSETRPGPVVTPLEGLSQLEAGGFEVVSDVTGGASSSGELANTCDVAVVVVGYTAADEGEYLGALDQSVLDLVPAGPDGEDIGGGFFTGDEGDRALGGDRSSLRLPQADVELIRAVSAKCERTIVVIEAGSAIVMTEWSEEVAAIVYLWYPGCEGGNALRDVLSGAVNPGAKLPFVIPVDEADLPHFDRNATEISYDGLWGQRFVDAGGKQAAYPFGFGLSYSSFEISDPTAEPEVDGIRVEILVRNLSARPGSEVVQLYARRGKSDCWNLIGFTRVEVDAEATTTAVIMADLDPLDRWDSSVRKYVTPALDSLEFKVAVSSVDAGIPFVL